MWNTKRGQGAYAQHQMRKQPSAPAVLSRERTDWNPAPPTAGDQNRFLRAPEISTGYTNADRYMVQARRADGNPAPATSVTAAPQQQSGGAYSAYSPGQAQSQQSPYDTATQYSPQQSVDMSGYQPQAQQAGATPAPQQAAMTQEFPAWASQLPFGGQNVGIPPFQFLATDFMGNQYDNPADLTAQMGATAHALNQQRHGQIAQGNFGPLDPAAAYQQGQQMLPGGWQNPFAVAPPPVPQDSAAAIRDLLQGYGIPDNVMSQITGVFGGQQGGQPGQASRPTPRPGDSRLLRAMPTPGLQQGGSMESGPIPGTQMYRPPMNIPAPSTATRAARRSLRRQTGGIARKPFQQREAEHRARAEQERRQIAAKESAREAANQQWFNEQQRLSERQDAREQRNASANAAGRWIGGRFRPRTD